MARKSRRSEVRGGSLASRGAAAMEFNPDYTYVRADLRRIGILAAGFISLLIILSFLVG